MGRISAVVNPFAGGWKRYPKGSTATGRASLLAAWLGTEESVPRILETSGLGDGEALARHALTEGYETIVAVGGDGTVREVAQALVKAGQGKLALLPMGTVNVLARTLSVPLSDPAAAGRVLYSGTERRLDVGRCEGDYFLLMAGIGLDGAVVHGINSEWKRRMGGSAYLMKALRLALRMPQQRITVTSDDGSPQTFDAYQVLIANTAEYGGSFRLGDVVRPDDGRLDIFVCRRRVPLICALLTDLNALARGRFAGSKAVHHIRSQRITISGECALAVQLDGDAAGHCPIQVECIPSVLTVHVP